MTLSVVDYQYSGRNETRQVIGNRSRSIGDKRKAASIDAAFRFRLAKSDTLFNLRGVRVNRSSYRRGLAAIGEGTW
jgi:hypothetical protein